MKVILQGTRGSYPTSNKENEYYGGNTSCIEVINGEERLILDAGTGILNVNLENYKAERIDILLTHLHMDHIQGLGFFKPLFNPQKVIHIWGPSSTENSLYERMNRYLSPPLFPVALRDIPSKLEFHEITKSSFKIGKFKIKAEFISHPGPTVGYRIQNGTSSFTYLPDHEPMIGGIELYDDIDWVSGFNLAAETDLLIHDAQYTAAEYSSKIGWGHSSMHSAAEFSKKTKAKRLIMFHHDPIHSDEIKNQMFNDFMSNHNYNFDIELAVQGKEIEL